MNDTHNSNAQNMNCFNSNIDLMRSEAYTYTGKPYSRNNRIRRSFQGSTRSLGTVRRACFRRPVVRGTTKMPTNEFSPFLSFRPAYSRAVAKSQEQPLQNPEPISRNRSSAILPNRQLKHSFTMVGRSTPPPCVLMSINQRTLCATNNNPCDDVIHKSTTNRANKDAYDIMEKLLEPIKSTKKENGKNLKTAEKGEKFRQVAPKRKSRKSFSRVNDLFKSRDLHGSTKSLFSGANKDKKLSRMGTFRMSTRVNATPNLRRKAGRLSIGDATTPSIGRRRLVALPQEGALLNRDEFADTNDFFEQDKKKNNRLSWRNWLPKKQARQEQINKEKPNENSLLKVLRSKVGVVEFRNFLKLEFSEENVDFWLDVEVFKQTKKVEKMAVKIFSKYISPNSPMEINIEFQTREKIREKIKTPEASMFNEAQRQIFTLMENDSFRRFCVTSSRRESLSNGRKNDVIKLTRTTPLLF